MTGRAMRAAALVSGRHRKPAAAELCEHGRRRSRFKDCRSAPIVAHISQGKKRERPEQAIIDTQGTHVGVAVLGPHQSRPGSYVRAIDVDWLAEHDVELSRLFCLGYAKSAAR